MLTRPDVDASPGAARSSRVRLWPVMVAAAPGLVLAWWSGLATTWDGSAFLFRIVHFGSPEVLHGRYGSVVWQLPAVLAANAGASIGVTRVLFGLGFVVVPLVALWLSWLVARDADPRLFTCAAFGILVSAVATQAFLVGEMLIALQLGWVVLLTAATGATTAWGRRLAAPVAVLILLTHPASVLVLVAAAVIVVLRWWAGGRGRISPVAVGLVVALLLAAGGRVLLINGYERANTGNTAFGIAWEALGGWGLWLIVAAMLMAAALLILVVMPAASPRDAGLVLPFVLLGAGGLVLAVWAAHDAAWAHAVNFRVFDGALMVPAVLALMAVVVTPRPDGSRVPARQHTVFMVGCGIVVSVVLAFQSFGWHDAIDALRADVARAPAGCVPFGDLPAVVADPLSRHWANALLVLEVQGDRPTVVALRTAKLCRRYKRTGEADLWPLEHPIELSLSHG